MSEPLESEEPVVVLRPAGEFLLRWGKQSWHSPAISGLWGGFLMLKQGMRHLIHKVDMVH